jgi:hypothetical protein
MVHTFVALFGTYTQGLFQFSVGQSTLAGHHVTRESSLHIFFTCKAVSDLVNHLASLYTFMFNRPMERSSSNILLLQTPRGCSSSLQSTFRPKYPPTSLVAKKQPATSGIAPSFAMLSAIIKSGNSQIHHCQMEDSACVNSASTAT